MIFEAVVNVFVAFLSFIGGLFPEIETPAWLADIAGGVSTVSGSMAALGNWIPFGAAGAATLLVVAALGVAVVVKLVRVGLSLVSGGGGGAG